MAKRKVVLLLHQLTLTGAPKIALDAFESLADEVELRIFSLENGPLESRCRQLGPLYVLNDLVEGWSTWKRAQRRLIKNKWESDLRKWEPDIIYVNSVAALPLALYLRFPDVPVLLHVHELQGIIDEYSGGDEDLFFEWPRHYIAVSEPVVDVMSNHYGLDKSRISLIHAFIRDEDFHASEELSAVAKAVAKEDGKFVVGGAGFPTWRKGMTLWLQMAAELTEILGPDKVRFVWVGVPDDRDGRQFHHIARKLKIDSVVDFVPVTPTPLQYFAKFDVFAMTSWEDPCPIVVLENMMLRKPVICFAEGGGAADEVAETGVVVDSFSPQAMALAIADLARSPQTIAELGQAARERVESHFVRSVQIPKILREIDALIQK